MTTKILFYDLETTGTNPMIHGIHQISGRIEIDNETKEIFDFKVRPREGCQIVDDALKVSNVTKEQIMEYPHPREVYRDLINLLSKYVEKYEKTDKLHLAGYNILAFDNQFLRQFFIDNNDQYFGSWFWPDSIDVYSLASNKYKQERSAFPNFQLRSVAKYAGIEVDESRLHDAQYDIEICMNLYKIVG